MHAFVCDFVRAFTNDGIAIAANRPIIATTIMISTSVKPDFLLFCMTALLIAFCFLLYMRALHPHEKPH